MDFFKILYDILKDRPDLFGYAVLILWAVSERSERKEQQKKNGELTDKMHDQNSDTKQVLSQIQVLLEILTRGRL